MPPPVKCLGKARKNACDMRAAMSPDYGRGRGLGASFLPKDRLHYFLLFKIPVSCSHFALCYAHFVLFTGSTEVDGGAGTKYDHSKAVM